jgi:DNA-directed RNA polymerase subunit RPC12/RpoP
LKKRGKRRLKKAAKMVEYKCFDCNKKVGADYLRKKVRCPYCGSKMLFKPRNVITKVKAR